MAKKTQVDEETVDLPEVRVGEVWESLAAADMVDMHRRLRVMEEPDGDGQVAVKNLVSGRVSHIALERFAPPNYRRAS